jgi:hypothetical protein
MCHTDFIEHLDKDNTYLKRVYLLTYFITSGVGRTLALDFVSELTCLTLSKV